MAAITGASSGIGAATARRWRRPATSWCSARAGSTASRRWPAPLGARALPLDVTDPGSVEAFAAAIPRLDVLVANAGKALGTDRIETAREELWETMFRTNVLGVLRTVRALLPKLEASGDGLIVIIGSIAGFETYRGGAGYTAPSTRCAPSPARCGWSCSASRSGHRASPGLVETEFSLVRFAGDARARDAGLRGDAAAHRRATSPSASAGSARCRRTSTSTSWWCARATRPPPPRSVVERRPPMR